MTIRDWADLTPSQLAPQYELERQRWLRAFQWETAEQWQAVEQARVRHALPGLVARGADSRVSGWLFYLDGPDGIQLGGVSAGDPATTAALVRAFRVRTAGRALTGFVPDLAPGLLAGLRDARVCVRSHPYLMRPLWTPIAAPSDALRIRRWADGDDAVAADVLASAYAPEEARLFAPQGTPENWQAYVRTLIDQIGCGHFDRGLSLVGVGEAGPAAVAMVTRLGHRSAHLAQIGVRPEVQGRGVGRALLAAAARGVAAAGIDALSLMVSSRNQPALALYGRAGFRPTGQFLEVSAEPISRAA